MEKQRTKSGSKFSRRLLAAFIFVSFVNPLHAKFLTNSDFANLHFSPVQSGNDSEFYTSTDIRFEVDVPYVRPGEIDIASPEDMDNASFKTLKRTELEGDDGGTRIEVWYSFSKKGTYTLKPLTLRVQGFKRSISFDYITVKLNPKDQDPVFLIRFNDGTIATSEDGFSELSKLSLNAGQKCSFDVLFQYGVQLVNFSWVLPKDSIFTQTKEYEILKAKYIDKAKLDEIVPVASFEWIPLLAGNTTFPVFSMTVTSNNGYKGEIKIPAVQIAIGEKVEGTTEAKLDLFNQAFMANAVEEIVPEIIEVTLDDCEELAELRIKERKSIFGIRRVNRVKKEASLGLPTDSDEFNVTWVYLSILLVVISLGLFIFFLRKKHIFTNILTTTFIIIAIVGLGISVFESKKEHGISYGCQLYSIPDALSEAKTDLKPGSYVEIIESSGEWYYILLGESGGWCKKSGIINIK